jgi:glutathionyl-hydroquinone reductase
MQDAVPMSVMHPVKDADGGWRFVREPDAQYPECSAAPFVGIQMRDPPQLLVRPATIQRYCTSKIRARSVPCCALSLLPLVPLCSVQLQDKQKSISSDGTQIMAILNSNTAAAATAPDYNPVQLQPHIQQLCQRIQQDVVENVRACGDADSQVRWMSSSGAELLTSLSSTQLWSHLLCYLHCSGEVRSRLHSAVCGAGRDG